MPRLLAALVLFAATALHAQITHPLVLFDTQTNTLTRLTVEPSEEASTINQLARHPNLIILHDRYVSGHALQIRRTTLPQPGTSPLLTITSHHTQPQSLNPADQFYNSPQGWAVLRSGGFGDNVPGGPSTGPWTQSLGAGVRIAVLDSGIDATHPDLSPSLALNLTEIDPQTLPSPCDDGSPQDQQGHGTWVASLAAGAIGPSTGEVIGVAPQATLLNIKVLQRMPATTATTQLANCEAGQAGGLLSWVLQGIQDAVASHADIISLSLGTLIDTSTSEGAGWKSAFDSVTYAASQSGTVIIAAAGNDGIVLTGTLIELPAQARGVLAVTATTNPACAESLTPNATCVPGPITRPFYSNDGPSLNAISAPGGSYPEGPDDGVSGFIRGACTSGIPNTTNGSPATNAQSFGCFNLGHTPYLQAIGTSASSALVAGAAAILRATHRTWTATQIIAALRATATSSPTTDPQLNLAAALAQF